MTATYSLTHNSVRVLISEEGDTYGWSVFNGKKHVSGGIAVGDLNSVLREITRKVVMPSKLAQGRLSSIATWPMARHEHVPARELRTGDLLHVGGSNYI